MAKGSSYYVIKEKAVPEVLLNVVKAKSLLETGKVHSVAEAAEQTGISRSSFYKYKDDIFVFHDNTEGKTLTFTCEMEDEPGLLSLLLSVQPLSSLITRISILCFFLSAKPNSTILLLSSSTNSEIIIDFFGEAPFRSQNSETASEAGMI